MNNHYNPNLREYSRELRTESVSKAEKFLWKAALSRNQQGAKFKRQRPIDRFIVDFFCQELGLIIEIDGSSHFFKEDYDNYRQEKLKSFGYSIMRFSEGDVLNKYESVLLEIQQVIECLKQQRITN
jgi:very-short-patch-repair endonuclease